ncbi:cofactor-independent phosphoglycerate mutase [Thermoproteota archaeon]
MGKKYIICLGDGMSDHPLKQLNGKTPLQRAVIPHMDFISKNGVSGSVYTVPKGCDPGSDVANMGLLGYDPRKYHTGRGPIEAVSMGLTIPKGKLAFRCNFVTIIDGIMKDFTAGHITNDEAAQLVNELNILFNETGITFYPGVSYRNITIMDEKYEGVNCTPPHDLTDKPIFQGTMTGCYSDELREFVTKCRTQLSKSSVNKRRLLEGKLPVTDIWIWGQGKMPKWPRFKDVYGLSGGIITAVDLLKGIGRLAGLETPDVEGATAFIDTNYEAKAAAAFNLLNDHDFVYIHVEAPDEAGHMGDAELKVKAIEDFDQRIVKPVLEYQKQHPETAVMILPDHPTPCDVKTHTAEPVPFAVYYPGMRNVSDNPSGQSYSEDILKHPEMEFSYSWELLDYFLHLPIT